MPDDVDLLAGLDIEPRAAGGDAAGAERASDAGDRGGNRGGGTGSDRGADTPSKRETLGADKSDKPEKGKRTEKSHRQSVADSIKSAWREHSGDEGIERDKPETGRERGPDGKFVKAEQADKNIQPRETAEKVAGIDPTKVDAGANGSAAPNGWNDAAKSEWAKLPPAVRDAVTKRETDMSEGARQLQARYGPIYQLTNDQTIASAAQKYGVSREQLLSNGFSWMIAVERNPAAGILGLCQAYKIDPKTLSTISATAAPAAQPGMQGTTTQQDPRVAQLEQRLNAFEQTRQTEANATQQAAIAHWSKDKKHFERVRPTMVQVIQIAAMQNDASILDPQGNVDLNKVYARAVRLHDDVFNDVLRESRSKRQADQTAEAQRARRTAASVSSGSPAGTEGDGEEKPLPKGSSVRQHITAAMRRVRA